MDSRLLEIDLSSEFGTYKLDCRRDLARKLATKVSSKPVVNFLRAVGGLRNCQIADVPVYGGRMRVYPGLNRSDKIMLGFPHIFDFAERKLLAEFLTGEEKPSFVDIGANIGAYSVFVSGLAINAKIAAVEADPEIFARLKFNLREDAAALNLAVSDEEGVLPFYIHATNRGENSLVASDGKKIEVTAKTLRQILDEAGIDQPSAMKIDVEGMEFQILNKFFHDAPRHRWPKMIIIEHLHTPDMSELFEKARYREVLKTKMNSVLRLEP